MVHAVWPHAAMLQAPGKHAATSTYCAEQKFPGLKARDLFTLVTRSTSALALLPLPCSGGESSWHAHPCLVRVKNRADLKRSRARFTLFCFRPATATATATATRNKSTQGQAPRPELTNEATKRIGSPTYLTCQDGVSLRQRVRALPI
jgi:hypothetical protein